MLIFFVCLALFVGFGIGWSARARMRRYLPGTVHVRYVADTSQAIAAIEALDAAIKRAPVDATIRIRCEMEGAGKSTTATYTIGDGFDDGTPRASAARFAKEPS